MLENEGAELSRKSLGAIDVSRSSRDSGPSPPVEIGFDVDAKTDSRQAENDRLPRMRFASNLGIVIWDSNRESESLPAESVATDFDVVSEDAAIRLDSAVMNGYNANDCGYC